MKPLLKTKDNVQVELKTSVSTTAKAFLLETGQGAELPQPISSTTDDAGSSTLLELTGAGNLGIQPLQEIWNITDGSHALVLSVSADQIITTPLKGGTNNVWGDGEIFSIDPFVLTVVRYSTDGSTEVQKELVRFYKRVGDQITADENGREQGGTTALEWLPGDYLELRNPSVIFESLADKINYLRQLIEGNATLPGNKTFSDTVTLAQVIAQNAITQSADATNPDHLVRLSQLKVSALDSGEDEDLILSSNELTLNDRENELEDPDAADFTIPESAGTVSADGIRFKLIDVNNADRLTAATEIIATENSFANKQFTITRNSLPTGGYQETYVFVSKKTGSVWSDYEFVDSFNTTTFVYNNQSATFSSGNQGSGNYGPDYGSGLPINFNLQLPNTTNEGKVRRYTSVTINPYNNDNNGTSNAAYNILLNGISVASGTQNSGSGAAVENLPADTFNGSINVTGTVTRSGFGAAYATVTVQYQEETIGLDGENLTLGVAKIKYSSATGNIVLEEYNDGVLVSTQNL